MFGRRFVMKAVDVNGEIKIKARVTLEDGMCIVHGLLKEMADATEQKPSMLAALIYDALEVEEMFEERGGHQDEKPNK